MKDTEVKPAYKQLWFWFVISLPLITVVAGIITYQIAADNPHSMVKDNYYKKGKGINQSLELKKNAERLFSQIELSINTESSLITARLILRPDQILKTKNLVLEFSHPTRADLDKKIILNELANNEFVGNLVTLEKAHWHILLNDEENNWLVKSRWLIPADNNIQIKF